MEIYLSFTSWNTTVYQNIAIIQYTDENISYYNINANLRLWYFICKANNRPFKMKSKQQQQQTNKQQSNKQKQC